MRRVPTVAALLTLLIAIDTSAASDASANRLNDRGFSPLHYAAMQGECETAARLLANGADVNVQQGTYLGTPLQYAAAAGHADVVELLVRHDAKVDAVDTHGRTPLMWAAWLGHHHVVALLLDSGAKIDLVTDGHWTALHYAASTSHLQTAFLLAQRGAPLEARNSLGKTAAQVTPFSKATQP